MANAGKMALQCFSVASGTKRLGATLSLKQVSLASDSMISSPYQ